MKKGFTLIEILIALAISAFVIMTIYNLLTSAIDTSTISSSKANEINEELAIQKMFTEDIASMTSDIVEKTNNLGEVMFAFDSLNSLFFDYSIPVRVAYVFEKNTLYRTEENIDLNYYEKYTILENVTDFNVYNFENNEYKEDFDRINILKFSIKTDRFNYEFVIGNILLWLTKAQFC